MDRLLREVIDRSPPATTSTVDCHSGTTPTNGLRQINMPVSTLHRCLPHDPVILPPSLLTGTRLFSPEYPGAMDRRKLTSQGTLEGAFLDLWQHCDHCGKRSWGGEKPKKCGGCGVVVYCDRECQRAAWQAHR